MKNATNNRERAKLLLADLEAELEILEEEEMNSYKAGFGGRVPGFPTGFFPETSTSLYSGFYSPNYGDPVPKTGTGSD